MLESIAYPLRIDDATGDLAISQDEDVLADDILSFVETLPGERVMVPEYGMKDPHFEPLNDILTYNVDLAIKLQGWIPQCTFYCKSEYDELGNLATSIFYHKTVSNNPVEKSIIFRW